MALYRQLTHGGGEIMYQKRINFMLAILATQAAYSILGWILEPVSNTSLRLAIMPALIFFKIQFHV